MSTGQKPQFPAGYSAKAALKSTAPDGAGIAERLRQWSARMNGRWQIPIQAASHIEAQDAEIARLRAALGVVAAYQWRGSDTIYRVQMDWADMQVMARAALAPQETQP